MPNRPPFRRDDPRTSKRAALLKSLEFFLDALHGRAMTVKEASETMVNPFYWHWEWAKHTKAWCVSGHIMAVGERDGAVVYRQR